MGRKISKVIYLLLGGLFLLGGIIAIINPNIGIPVREDGSTNEVMGYTALLVDELLHATMELSSTFIGLGTVMLWKALNFEKTAVLDYLFLLFFIIFAGIHWFEFIQGTRSIMSPLTNSIPLLLLTIVIFLRKKERPSE